MVLRGGRKGWDLLLLALLRLRDVAVGTNSCKVRVITAFSFCQVIKLLLFFFIHKIASSHTHSYVLLITATSNLIAVKKVLSAVPYTIKSFVVPGWHVFASRFLRGVPRDRGSASDPSL